MRRGVIPAEASRGQPPAVPVSIAAASRRDVPIHLTGLGTVQATFTVGIHSQVDGKLQDVFFKEGQRVKKGDVLAKIDPRLFQAALDQAKAKKAQDEAQLTSFQKDLDALPDARSQGLRHAAEPRSAAGQGRHRQGLDRGRRSRDRNRADAARLHQHHRAQRRTHGRAPGRPGQHRACLRPRRRSRSWCRRNPRPSLFTLPAQTLDDVREAHGARRRSRSSPTTATTATPAEQRHAATIDNVIDQATATYPAQGDLRQRGREAVAG